jgi:hypothetical protein
MTWLVDVIATRLVLEGVDTSEDMAGFPIAVTRNAHLLSNREEGVFTATARWVKKVHHPISAVRTEVTDPSSAAMMERASAHVSARGSARAPWRPSAKRRSRPDGSAAQRGGPRPTSRPPRSQR